MGKVGRDNTMLTPKLRSGVNARITGCNRALAALGLTSDCTRPPAAAGDSRVGWPKADNDGTTENHKKSNYY